jgi:hypothetical protein
MTNPSGRTLPRPITARDLAARWPILPHLTPEEAAAFGEDVTSAKAALRSPVLASR